MLSVLIATYNWNAVPLAKNLCQQLEKSKIKFEIICIDDASQSVLNIENEQINELPNANFSSLTKNIGRSSLRNLLVSKSKYDWLLFLDGDILPASSNFILTYIQEIKKEKYAVILGGIAYKNDKNTHQLRWRLGKKGEEQPAEIRNKNPYQYFFTGNFLIDKKVFKAVRFDENLTKYGYEDLLFSKQLEKESIDVKHINNAVFHLGIDNNKTFLNKTKQAIENLSLLLKTAQISKKDTKLSNLFFKLKPFGIPAVLSLFVAVFEKGANKKSSLFFYNLFRIGYLHKVFKNVN